MLRDRHKTRKKSFLVEQMFVYMYNQWAHRHVCLIFYHSRRHICFIFYHGHRHNCLIFHNGHRHICLIFYHGRHLICFIFIMCKVISPQTCVSSHGRRHICLIFHHGHRHICLIFYHGRRHICLHFCHGLLKLLEKVSYILKETAPKFQLSDWNMEANCDFWKPSFESPSKSLI